MPLVVRGRLNPGTSFQALESGTAGNPSVAFRQSQSTGLFLPVDNALGITANGQECLRATNTKTIVSTALANLTTEYSNVSTYLPFISANVSIPDLTTFSFIDHLDVTALQKTNMSNVTTWSSSVGLTTSALLPVYKSLSIEPMDKHVQLVDSGANGPYFSISGGSASINFASNGSFASVVNTRVHPGSPGDALFDFFNDDGDFIRLYRHDASGRVSFSVSARSAVFTTTTSDNVLTGDWQTIGCRAYRVTSTTWNLSIWVDGFSVAESTVTGSLDNVIMTNTYVGRSYNDQYTSLDLREILWVNDVIQELAFKSIMSYMQTKYGQMFYSLSRDAHFSVESNVSYHQGLLCDVTGRVSRVRGINGVPLKDVGSWYPPNMLRYSIVDILKNSSDSSALQPSLDSYTAIPSAGFVGSYGFLGSTLLADGRVLLVPHNATVAEVYTPSTRTTASFGSFPGLNAFAGGILLPNGSVYLIPWAATQARIIDPNTYTVETPTGTFGGNAAYFGGTLMGTGELFLNPYNATEAFVYDYRTDASFTVPGYPGSGAYLGCVLLPNGKVFSVPYNTTRGRLYDPVSRTISLTSAIFGTGQALYYGGCLLPSGEVFCIPHNSTKAAIYNPITDSVRFSSNLFPGTAAFASGTLLPDGRVLCTPWTSTSCFIYDPESDTATSVPYQFSGLDACAGATLLEDGSVFLAPCNSTQGALISTGGMGLFSLSRNVLTSPYLNSF